MPQVRAKVIINARTGSVVMKRTVTIDEAAIAYGNLSVVISNEPVVNQPDTPFGGGQTVVTNNTQIAMRSETGTIKHVRTSANLADVVQALNALGATPQDLLSILQTLKAAGALHADLERSEEHTSELQSLMRISYAVFCLKKKKNNKRTKHRPI